MKQNTPFDVTVIGNVGIDTNVYQTDRELNFNVESNFTINVDYLGQAGGFTSRGFAKMGLKTAFIGYIGKDYSGDFILNEFQQDGINVDGMFIDPAGTSRSINFMFPDGTRKNFYDGKSHMILQPDLGICEDILKNSKLVHFHIPNWARQLLPLAKKLGLIISSDIQDVITIDDPYRRDFIKYADVLFFSAVNHDSPEKIIRKIMEQFPNNIIISGMGNKGCALGMDDSIRFFPAVELDKPVIDTNGAGDALAVGFLYSYFFEKSDIEKSVMSGQIAARYTCSQKASSTHLITREQLYELAADRR